MRRILNNRVTRSHKSPAKYLYVVVSFLLLFVSYCSVKNKVNARDIEPGQYESVDSCALDGDSLQFKQFLLKFSKDTFYQLKHINFPLSVESTNDEGDVERSNMQRKQWSHLDFAYDPESALREINAYEQLIEVDSDSCVVTIKGIDNGISVDYIFIRKNKDWYLNRLLDLSY